MQRSLSADVFPNFSHVTSLRNDLRVWKRQMFSDASGKQFLNASLSVKSLSDIISVQEGLNRLKMVTAD